jgi:hypothetical protein
MATAAAACLAISTPAAADIINVSASASQGTLTHNAGNQQTGALVTGDLGSNGPNIVNFTADTTGPGDELFLAGGNGQATIEGAEIGPKENGLLYSGDIFLTDHAAMTWIELALTGTLGGGTVDFFLTDGNGTVWNFPDLAMGQGDTHFGFQAINGQVITNLHFSADSPPGTISLIKQVRIQAGPGAVPEPATWGLMLLGFGGIGMALRRSRRRSGALMQIA